MACLISKYLPIPCITNPLVLDILLYLIALIVALVIVSILYDLFAPAIIKARRYHKKGERLYKKGKYEKAQVYYFLADHFRQKKV